MAETATLDRSTPNRAPIEHATAIPAVLRRRDSATLFAISAIGVPSVILSTTSTTAMFQPRRGFYGPPHLYPVRDRRGFRRGTADGERAVQYSQSSAALKAAIVASLLDNRGTMDRHGGKRRPSVVSDILRTEGVIRQLDSQPLIGIWSNC